MLSLGPPRANLIGSFPYPLDGNGAIRLAKTLCCGVLTQTERHCVTMRSKAGMSWVFPSRRGSLSRVAAPEDALRAAREPDAPATPIERRVWPLHPDLPSDHVRSPQIDRGEFQAFRTPLTWASSIFSAALVKCASEAIFVTFPYCRKLLRTHANLNAEAGRRRHRPLMASLAQAQPLP
jgi:hypothetical protein